MKAFSGQKFSSGVAQDQEAFAFLLELKLMLSARGWKSIPPQSASPFVVDVMGMGDTTGAGTAALENAIGVTVEYPHPSDGESIRKARALVSALEKHGIDAKEGTRTLMAPDTLNVVVGDKPGRWKWPQIPAKSP